MSLNINEWHSLPLAGYPCIFIATLKCISNYSTWYLNFDCNHNVNDKNCLTLKSTILDIFNLLEKIQGVPKKERLRILNRFDSCCLKEHLHGSKLGKNMWNAFSMAWQYLILM